MRIVISYFYCYVYFIVFTWYPYWMLTLKQTKPLNPFHVLYPAKNVRKFDEFLMLLKGNVLKKILEHDLVNGAFEWKSGMSRYVFPKQKCRNFVTKFIVCLPILSRCPLYTNSFQGFNWFRLGNSELSKTSNHYWFPKRFSEILLGFVQCCFISGVSIDSDYRLLKWQNL